MGKLNLNIGFHLSLVRQIFDKHQQDFYLDLESRIGKMQKMESFERTAEQHQRLRTTQASINKSVVFSESVESYVEQLETTLAGKISEAEYWKSEYQRMSRRLYRSGGYKTPRLPS